MLEFELTEDYIELIKLLKVLQIAENGAMAKTLVENGEVVRNGEPESRKRAKIQKRRGNQSTGPDDQSHLIRRQYISSIPFIASR